MNMVKLSKVMTDEHKAEEFLREIGILKTFRECPYCGNKQFGKVRRNFYNATFVSENGALEKEVFWKE